MRIVAGEHRGRRLKPVPGQGTRPMLDRVKEALFSTLGDRVEGARVVDLFAGSGGLGLEALSRGAAAAVFVERDARARRVLAENVAALGVGDRATVVGGDALDAAAWGSGAVDLAFLDPPFPLFRGAGRRRVLAALAELLDRLAPAGVVVFHVPRRELRESELPPGCTADERAYGAQSIWYVERSGADPGEPGPAP